VVKDYIELILLSEVPIEQVFTILSDKLDIETISKNPNGKSNRWTVIIKDKVCDRTTLSVE
jgi:hypothetical protein